MQVACIKLVKMQNAVSQLMILPQPAKLSYKLGKIMAKIHSVLVMVEKQRIELVKKYGDLTPDKKNYNVPADKMEKFNVEFDRYINSLEPVEIDVIPFELLEGLRVSAADMMMLEDIIDAPKEEEK